MAGGRDGKEGEEKGGKEGRKEGDEQVFKPLDDAHKLQKPQARKKIISWSAFLFSTPKRREREGEKGVTDRVVPD